MRLGVGKAEEDSFYTAAENIVRKRLEVEVQAEEDESRMRRREVAPAPPTCLNPAAWRCCAGGGGVERERCSVHAPFLARL